MSNWFKDTAERAAKTFLQGFLAVITVDSFTAIGTDWDDRIYVGLLAGAYSVLSSVASSAKGNNNSASLVDPS